MKILRLKAKNINSLKGDTQIDFVKFLNGNSLFTITGETGSGKTTILDIITCALYGRTARLSRGSEIVELMSHGTTEALCSVEFEVNGDIYRSSWMIRRARNSLTGKVQPVQMELVSLKDDHILESKASRVPKKIAQITGLDFERFSKSMMLAQGGFDAFLKAEEKERSKLLEKMTGTQIYSEISKITYEHTKEGRDKIELLKHSIESIGCLTNEEREQLQKEYQLKKDELQNCKINMKKAQNDYELKKDYILLIKELENNTKKEKEAQTNIEDNKEMFTKLTLGENALSISTIYTQKKEIEKQFIETQRDISKLTQNISKLQQELQQLSTQKTKLQKRYIKEEDIFKTENEKIKKALILQNKLEDISQSIKAKTTLISSKKSQLIKIQEELTKIQKLQTKLESIKKQHQEYQTTHKEDINLISDIKSINSLIKDYNNTLEDIKKTKQLYNNTTSKQISTKTLIDDAIKLSNNLKEKLDSTTKLYENKNQELKELESKEIELKTRQKLYEELDKKLKEFYETTNLLKDEKTSYQTYINSLESLNKSKVEQQEKITLLKEYIQTLQETKEKELLIQKYEEDRKKLKDNEPCFLCGSTTHPYITQRYKPSQDINQKISTQTAKLNETQKLLTKIEKDISSYETKKHHSQLESKKLEESLQTITKLFDKHNISLDIESEANIKETLADITSKLDALKDLRKQKDTLLNQKDKEHQEYIQASKSLEQYKNRLSTLQSELKHLQDTLDKCNITLKNDEDKLKAYLKTYNIEFIPSELTQSYQVLKQRDEKFQQSQKELKETNEQLSQLDIQKSKLSTQLDSEQKYLQELEQDINGLQATYQQITKEKKQLLDVENLVEYQKMITSKWQQIQQEFNDITKQYDITSTTLTTKTKSLEDLTTNHQQKELKKANLTKEFETALKAKGFETQKAFEDSILTDKQLTQLRTLSKKLTTALETIQALKKNNEAKLNSLKLKNIPTQDIELLEQMKNEQEKKFGLINQEVGELDSKLQIDRQNQNKIQEKQKELEIYAKRQNVLEKLNELIGSSDGTKFARFAQGITLEYLVYLANQHLSLLSKRYKIVRLQKEDPLELAIIDKYQADTVRPSQTLSGGESFLVSLSLALGLSELASQKISIDSLFLDEGFGTLDSDTLDIALDALSMLESRGKMIGIISHIEMLKERIPLQIAIHKKGGGESTIELIG